MCNSLFAMEAKQKESFFDKTDKKGESSEAASDFDALLDEFIKTHLEAEEESEEKEVGDFLRRMEATEEESEPEEEDATDDDWSHSDDDLRQNDYGSAKVNVEIKRKSGFGFADVAGMDSLKQLLKRNFIDIVLHKDKAKKYNIQPSNGILLYGPPGCGKTYIAEKIAQVKGVSLEEVAAVTTANAKEMFGI